MASYPIRFSGGEPYSVSCAAYRTTLKYHQPLTQARELDALDTNSLPHCHHNCHYYRLVCDVQVCELVRGCAKQASSGVQVYGPQTAPGPLNLRLLHFSQPHYRSETAPVLVSYPDALDDEVCARTAIQA